MRNIGYYTKKDGTKAYWSHDDANTYEAFIDGFEAARTLAPYTTADEAFEEYYPSE